MPYSPGYSYNYSMPNIDFSGLMSQAYGGASGLMGQRYAGEGQLQDARLQSARELAQMGYGSAEQQQAAQLAYQRELDKMLSDFQQQQFGSNEQQRRFQNDAAIRNENWSKSLSNPAVSGAVQQNISNVFSSPISQEMREEGKRRLLESEMRSAPKGGYFPGSFMIGQNPVGYASYGGSKLPTAKQ